jgi:hypothetical protein
MTWSDLMISPRPLVVPSMYKKQVFYYLIRDMKERNYNSSVQAKELQGISPGSSGHLNTELSRLISFGWRGVSCIN